MIRSFLTSATSLAVLATLAGCASYPAPVQRMADAEAAARSANEIGAGSSPQARLHMKLALEEIAQAKQFAADGDNKRADYVLIRAKADAELALAEARDERAAADAAQAAQDLANAKANAGQVPTSVTTTTSATTTTTTTNAGGKP
jgi:hypothetical protein